MSWRQLCGVHVHACMCICTWGYVWVCKCTCAHVWEAQGLTSHAFLHYSVSYIFEAGSILASQEALRIFLPASPGLGLQVHTTTPTFRWVLGIELKPSQSKYSTEWTISPVLYVAFEMSLASVICQGQNPPLRKLQCEHRWELPDLSSRWGW